MKTTPKFPTDFKLGVYRHYKGGVYIVDRLAIDSDTGEIVVNYRDARSALYFTRRLETWLAPIGIGDIYRLETLQYDLLVKRYGCSERFGIDDVDKIPRYEHVTRFYEFDSRQGTLMLSAGNRSITIDQWDDWTKANPAQQVLR